MKTFLKIVLAVVIVAVICVGVYFVLPESAKTIVDGNIQYRTDETAKGYVDKIKDTTIPDSDVTFGDGLEAFCKTTAWYYEEVTTTVWTVTFYGTKATLNLTDAGLNAYYTERPFKVVFSVENDKNVTITMQIDDDIISDDESKAATYKTIADAAK